MWGGWRRKYLLPDLRLSNGGRFSIKPSLPFKSRCKLVQRLLSTWVGDLFQQWPHPEQFKEAEASNKCWKNIYQQDNAISPLKARCTCVKCALMRTHSLLLLYFLTEVKLLKYPYSLSLHLFILFSLKYVGSCTLIAPFQPFALWGCQLPHFYYVNE